MLRGDLKARPGLGEPGAKELPLTQGATRRHGPQAPKPRAPEQAKEDRLCLIILVVRQKQRLPGTQQGLEDLIARGPGRRFKPRRSGAHGNADAMPRETQGDSHPSHLGLCAIGVGGKPMIHVHHPRRRPPRVPAMARR